EPTPSRSPGTPRAIRAPRPRRAPPREAPAHGPSPLARGMLTTSSYDRSRLPRTSERGCP
ncbi:hypothetical protein, partial [Streptomyces sp. SID8380]|uniref:hypothetical protein n=1 Tax=Streptomyces sp. SID8380 TaxID=2690360 RepID=UPI001F1CA33D